MEVAVKYIDVDCLGKALGEEHARGTLHPTGKSRPSLMLREPRH
jgi:hypothetical protein